MNLLLTCRRVLSRNSTFGRGFTRVPEELVPSTLETGLTNAEIDEETIRHLERLSLVDFANKRGIVRLQEAVKFAGKLESVDTTGVKPLVSVLEDEVLSLRQDEVTEINHVRLVLSTAQKKEEDYYVAPPGNIPLVSRDLKDLE